MGSSPTTWVERHRWREEKMREDKKVRESEMEGRRGEGG